MLPAAWVLPHFGFTSVLLVDGTRAWFEDEDLEEHGYCAPPFPHSDKEKLDGGGASSGDAGATRTAATAPAATSTVAAT